MRNILSQYLKENTFDSTEHPAKAANWSSYSMVSTFFQNCQPLAMCYAPTFFKLQDHTKRQTKSIIRVHRKKLKSNSPWVGSSSTKTCCTFAHLFKGCAHQAHGRLSSRPLSIAVRCWAFGEVIVINTMLQNLVLMMMSSSRL